MNKSPFLLRRRHHGTFFILTVIAAGMLAILFEMVVDMGTASFASDQAAGATDLAGYVGTIQNNSMRWVCVAPAIPSGCARYEPLVTVNLGGEDNTANGIITEDTHLLNADGTKNLQFLNQNDQFRASSPQDPEFYHVTTNGTAKFQYNLPYPVSGTKSTMYYTESTTDYARY